MSIPRFRRPSPATVISLVALGVALGGTGYAATQINGNTIAPGTVTATQLASSSVTEPKIASTAVTRRTIRDAAVGGAQIANGGVTNPKILNNAVNAAKIASNAVTTPKVANGAITREKLAANARSVSIVVRFSQKQIPINTTDTIIAQCQSGETPLSGGFGGLPDSKSANQTQANVIASRPNPTTQGATPTGWLITVDNSSRTRATVTAFVVCGSRQV